ncbi:MAG: hypothetical protein J6B93_03395 [Clostridia bacterium]|nr:hypothetical protein [Clostridia bacterium]
MKYLLKNGRSFLKANLNCLTASSGGRLSPEEAIAEYYKRGYGALALEAEIAAPQGFSTLFAYRQQIGKFTFMLYKAQAAEPPKVSPSDEMDPNAFIARANASGWLVSLCHPAKSMLTYGEYSALRGLFAIEITNYSSQKSGCIEDNNHLYDRMLRQGISPLYPIAVDGNRNAVDFSHPDNDSFGAFTMINPKSDLFSALKGGEFYASTGPLIDEVYYDEGKIHIKCSPVRSIRLLNEGRDAPVAIAPKGETITRAVFDLDPAFCGSFIRVDIRDEKGRFADTVAFSTENITGGAK